MDEIQKLKEHIAELEGTIRILKRDLIHDSLTGLKTRRFFEDRAKLHLSNIVKVDEGKRQDWFGFKNLSFLFIDIDNFKKINDIYGHSTGDDILRLVSGIIAENVRGGDVAARWGGEEIIVMLLGANEQDAKEKAENIRKKVESKSFETVPGLKVTISVGVAMYTKGIALNQLVKNSDLALYRAKETGRNKVVAFSEL